jgi:hypothetical protein
MLKFRVGYLWVLFVLLIVAKQISAIPQNHPSKITFIGQLMRENADSSTNPQQNGFASEREALDTLVHYLISPKLTMNYGFLSEDSFVAQVRKVDTLTPVVMVHAQYVQYKYRVQKGVVKFRKYLKEHTLNLKKKDSTNGLPALISWPPVVYKSKGNAFNVTRYEVEIIKRKFKFILQYELWWINDRAYWNNDFRYYEND